jgi:TolB-like protein/predicted Ser/Thr protein kinase
VNCRKRFKREAQAAAKLDHPNIVPVHEVGEFKGRPFFAMAHIEGKSLRNVIEVGKLSVSDSIGLTMQICEGLYKAHESGVVHRDIKPSNIIIDAENRPRIVDFGLATVSGGEKLTKTGSMLGTLRYMSPEQVRGEKVDQRSDLFSLGSVLYEMVTGKPAFSGDYEAERVHEILNVTPEPLARYKSCVSGELQQIVEKALAKDPALRYQHADSMLTDLKRLSLTGSPRKKSRIVLWAVAAVVIVMGCYISYHAFISSPPAGGQPERIMLAVLPFANLGNPGDEYFADGITDEIISRLAKLSGLGVISRTSVIQYKGTDKSLPVIADELKVDYILEGTIRWDKAGDSQRVRITPQLIRVSDNIHIWSDIYERSITSIFDIQSDIASQVSGAFGIVLLGDKRDLIERQPTGNFDAYQYYLRAMDYLDRPTNLLSHIRVGIQYLDSAVANDPGFALAYAELSIAHSRMYHHNFDRSESRQQRVREAAARALELEPSLPEAMFAMGSYHYRVRRDYDAAFSMINLALQGKPNDNRILALLGFVERRSGRFEDAAMHFLQALRLNPRDAGVAWEIANTYRAAKMFALAQEYCLISLEIEPNLPDAQIMLVRNWWSWFGSADSTRTLVDTALSKYFAWIIDPFLQLIYDGDYLKAVELCDSLPKDLLLDDNFYYPGDQLRGWAYFLKGDLDSVTVYFQSAATKLKERLETTSIPARIHSELAIVYAYLGKTDEAVSFARKAVELLPISKDAFEGSNRLRDLALVLAIAGRRDEAMTLVDSLLRIPSELSVAVLRLDKRWSPLYDHPSFPALIDKYERTDGT